MPLDLIPPGKRKNNRYYIARGTIAGRQFEISTKTADKAAAEKYAADCTSRILNGEREKHAEVKPLTSAKTFADAANRYLELHVGEARRLRPIIKDIGAFELSALTQAGIVACANRLCQGQKNSSKNRKVVTPISSVMHYAANNRWCEWLKIQRFKEATPPTRAMHQESAAKLIDAASGNLKVLLVFLFHQGMRITDTLHLTWERLNLKDGLIYVRIGKINEWKWKALHPDARAALANLEGSRVTFVFHLRTRWAVYDQLARLRSTIDELREETGVLFTPHVARHSLGTWLGAKGTSLKTIMDILNHTDPKSSMRYQMTELPEQRAAFDAIGSMRTSSKSAAKKK